MSVCWSVWVYGSNLGQADVDFSASLAFWFALKLNIKGGQTLGEFTKNELCQMMASLPSAMFYIPHTCFEIPHTKLGQKNRTNALSLTSHLYS